MKKLLIILTAFFMINTAFNQNNVKNNLQKPADGPVIKFDSLSYDFGEVTDGTKVVHKFHFKNTGNKPLLLTEVAPSCGCTIPTWPRKPVLPGEDNFILISFDSAGKGGTTVVKSISVTTNMTEGNTIVLEISGKVLKKK